MSRTVKRPKAQSNLPVTTAQNGNGLCFDTDQIQDPKFCARLISNRKSAQRSRDRKAKEHAALLEENEDLREENEDLREENEDLREENEDLREENEDLREENAELRRRLNDTEAALDIATVYDASRWGSVEGPEQMQPLLPVLLSCTEVGLLSRPLFLNSDHADSI
jgi:FtsZ-binding cell division protein ZapB